MKAAAMWRFGGPEVMEYATLPTPDPGPGEVLIKVGACGINRYDLYHRMGAVFQDVSFPHVLGADVAGTVEALGPGVMGLHCGDAVLAAPGHPLDPADWDIVPDTFAPSYEVTGTHSWGGGAEYLRMPERFVLKNDTGLAVEEVAAMPLVLATAVHAVQTLGEVRSGMKILVQAGASGSGSTCVQLARALGARVATTVGRDEKIVFARECGAELVWNRRDGSFASAVLDWTDGKGVDVVIDNVGAAVFEDNLRCLRVGGVFVNFGLLGGMTATLNFRELFFRQHQLRGSFMGSRSELEVGLGMLRTGKIKAKIDRRFPLSETSEAHRYVESRAVQGKVVLIP